MSGSINLKIKPLSINEAWQGKRFKTPAYKKYEQDVLLLLPKIKLPSPPFELSYEFGFSNTLSDFDNPVKPITDILQKKYKINDRDIFKATIIKTIVKKGSEFISIQIMTLK